MLCELIEAASVGAKGVKIESPILIDFLVICTPLLIFAYIADLWLPHISRVKDSMQN